MEPPTASDSYDTDESEVETTEIDFELLVAFAKVLVAIERIEEIDRRDTAEAQFLEVVRTLVT